MTRAALSLVIVPWLCVLLSGWALDYPIQWVSLQAELFHDGLCLLGGTGNEWLRFGLENLWAWQVSLLGIAFCPFPVDPCVIGKLKQLAGFRKKWALPHMFLDGFVEVARIYLGKVTSQQGELGGVRFQISLNRRTVAQPEFGDQAPRLCARLQALSWPVATCRATDRA